MQDSSPSCCYSMRSATVQPGVNRNGRRHTLQFFVNTPTGREKGSSLICSFTLTHMHSVVHTITHSSIVHTHSHIYSHSPSRTTLVLPSPSSLPSLHPSFSFPLSLSLPLFSLPLPFSPLSLPFPPLPPSTAPSSGLYLAADNSGTQFTWIRCLSSIGVEILSSVEEEESVSRSATSVFDFDAYDIDRRRIPLSSFRCNYSDYCIKKKRERKKK